MGIDKTVSQFRSSDRDDVAAYVAEMDRLASATPGWIQLQPWVDPEQRPKENLLRRIFSANGPPIPTATWVPAAKSGEAADQIGITHGSGPMAYERLQDAGVELPNGWLVVSDHRHRGFVIAGQQGTSEELLRFMLAATAVLSMVPTDDRWMIGVLRRK